MGRFKNRFLPDIFIDDIYKISVSELKSRGAEAVIFDIDNTLVTYDDPVAPDHTREFFDRLHAAGIKTFIVSNNNKERVKKFAESLGEPYYAAALKPLKKYMRLACGAMGVSPERTVLAGDQLFTDIYGGNRMGMLTVLVEPISEKEVGFVKFKRNFERLILKDTKKRE